MDYLMRLADLKSFQSDSLYLTPAMRFMKAWFWFCLGAILFACTPTPDRTNFNYLRSPSFFRADTTGTNDSLCGEPSRFKDKDACLASKKYQLTWSRPEDTTNLVGYRIYLDTIGDGGKPWSYIRDHAELASIVVLSQAPKDTLVFAFEGTGALVQDTLRHGIKRVFLIDSLHRSEDRSGKLVFGLVPVYGGDVTPGQPQFAYFKTTDKDPPDPFHPRVKPMAKEISVAWERPTDRVSFFDPSQDTGLIRGYRVSLTLQGRPSLERKLAFKPKVISYLIGEKDMTASVTDSLNNDTLPTTIVFRLSDSSRSAKRSVPLPSDSLHLVIGNLKPQDTLQLFLYAIDSNGNQNDTAMEKVTVHTTDTTQPSKPVLSTDSTTHNGFVVKWVASRDSTQEGENRQAGPHANFNIQKYQLTRILLRRPGERTTGLDRIDSTIVPVPADSSRDSFTVAMKFLPPGTAFRLSLTAVDNSGFESDTDTLTVATDSVRFAEGDSTMTCPAGFIPIPRAKFKIGDDSPAASIDETPSRVLTMGSFCIEPYEHRDSTSKRFVSNVTFEQAEKICADINPDFGTGLCSEAEWERSCEGPGADSASLLHGIQSENKNASILQSSCNQATNDSAMAMSFELRNSVCLTTEGVYDMAGNLSEWVRDPYASNAYAGIKDSVMDPDFTFADTALTDSSAMFRKSIRGGNYLKTNFPQLSTTQNLARCSNRDFAQQVRPQFRDECKNADSVKIAIIYGPGLEGHRCMALDPSLELGKITDIIPSLKDSSELLAFISGQSEPQHIKIVLPDTVFQGKRPVSARLTTRSLAVVTFENVAVPTRVIKDTLDANEMKDTSQSSLEKIFKREAGNSQWFVQKDQTGKFIVQYLYAYSVLGTKPARDFYSSRAIGFRCCSRAKASVHSIATANP
ncbi:MAG: putative lipoprotein [Fibrobacteres bacterium]|nr:putative lipoprotein [Fibrobacterota bacterium]